MNEAAAEVSYSEINAMVRLGQRMELEAYLRQFQAELFELAKRDLPLAKARFISLLSMLVISTLEIGAPQSAEKHIAEAASEVTNATLPHQLISISDKYFSHVTMCATPNANRFAIQIVERAKQIVAENYPADLSDEKIAHHLCLSRSHFRHLFREITGMPFKRYVTEFRLNTARRLLEKSTMSVKEVANEVGYADPSSFCRAYRAYHGVAPSTHRTASV